jgi:hypothetical protein
MEHGERRRDSAESHTNSKRNESSRIESTRCGPTHTDTDTAPDTDTDTEPNRCDF